MPYTPNNPYIPGDPYSYDLKWLVTQVKANRAALDGLDERIRNIVIRELDQHDPVYYSTAQELIDSPQKAGSIAYIEGFNAAGDGGANLYRITDDYNDIIGADFYLTMAAPNLWALPIILTPYVTPEMFGAAADGATDDTAAFEIAINSGMPVEMKANAFYKLGTATLKNDVKIIGNNSTVNLIINNGVHSTVISSDGYNINISDMTFKGTPHATSAGTEIVSPIINISNADINLNNITFSDVQPYNFRNAPVSLEDRDCSLLRSYNGDVTMTNSTLSNCRNQEMIFMLPDTADPSNTGVFDNIELDNNNYSFMLLCKDLRISNIHGDHPYNGSVFNAFGLNSTTVHNVSLDIDYNAYPGANIIDNTEGGLFNSKELTVHNVNGPCRFQAENITADSIGPTSLDFNNTINTTLSPLTQKSAFTAIKWRLNNCEVLARTGYSIATASTTVDAVITNSVMTNNIIPRDTCVLDKFRIVNSDVVLPLTLPAATNEYILSDCKITGITPGFTAYIINFALLFGCWADSAITLYTSIPGGQSTCYACHNITP